MLVRDKGIRGVVLAFGQPAAYIRQEGTRLLLGSGTLLSAVAQYAAEHGLTGLEFAAGIPGSVGGAVFMNAGAYDPHAGLIGMGSALLALTMER